LKKNIEFLKKTVLFILSVTAIALLLELSLIVGNVLFIGNNNQTEHLLKKDIILCAGDSWAQGSDALKGESFFSLLEKDPYLKRFSLVNLGYGSNNYFQAVNSIINYKKAPRAVIIIAGINAWHLIGLEEFIDVAKDYLTITEVKQLSKDLKVNYEWAWVKKFRIYKLYCYLLNRNRKPDDINIGTFDNNIATEYFWRELVNFREQYPDIEGRRNALVCFIKDNLKLNLDQKFYFTALELGFDSENMELLLKKSGIFFPEDLKIIPYQKYKQLDVNKGGFVNLNGLIIKWSLKVLSTWAKKNNVIVFVQNYPDIMKGLNDNSFEDTNSNLKLNVQLNNLEFIDHNSTMIDWGKYRTCWHVNSQGHRLMKDNIKFCFFRNNKLIPYDKYSLGHSAGVRLW